MTNIGENDFEELPGELFASNCQLTGVGIGPAKKPPRISPFLFHNNKLLKKVDLGGLKESVFHEKIFLFFLKFVKSSFINHHEKPLKRQASLF